MTQNQIDAVYEEGARTLYENAALSAWPDWDALAESVRRHWKGAYTATVLATGTKRKRADTSPYAAGETDPTTILLGEAGFAPS